MGWKEKKPKHIKEPLQTQLGLCYSIQEIKRQLVQ